MKIEKLFLAVALLGGALYLGNGIMHNQPPFAPVEPRQPFTPAVKPVLYVFTSDHCVYCDQLHQAMQAPEVQAELVHFEVRETKGDRALEHRYKIKGYPTLVAVDPGHPSKAMGKHEGAMDPPQLASWLKALPQIKRFLAHIEGGGKPQEGGLTSPDGSVEIVTDLPRSLRRKNVGGRDGAGLCVFTSIEFAGKWQNEPELFDFQDKMRKELGGGYPEKVDKMMAKYAPHVKYVQDTTGDSKLLEAVLKSGRMAGVTYNGHDPHYGGSIAHMVDCVFYDEAADWAAILDNNFIEDNQIVWMSCAEFKKRWGGNGGGWLVFLLAPPPPPVPHN